MKKLLAIIILWVPLAAFALKPIMIITYLTGNVPLDRAGSETIHYEVTNNSNQTLQNMTVIANAGLNGSAASAVSLSNNTCNTLAPNATCTFSVSVAGNKNLPNSFSLAPSVCAYNNQVCSRPDESNREVITVLTQVYVTNFDGDTVSLCNVDTSTGTLTCVPAGGNGFSEPTSVALMPSLTGAYVTNLGNGTVTFCTVNTTNGTFNAPCETALDNIQNPLFITLNAAGTIAYLVADSSIATTVLKCSVNTTSGLLGPCVATGSGFSGPTSIAINPVAPFAYITNSNGSSVSICSIEADGDLTDCTISSDTFNLPESIAFNSTGTVSYIASLSLTGSSNGLVICTVDTTSGNFSSCSTPNTGIINPYGLAVMLDNSFLFLTAPGLDSVYSCQLNSSGGIDDSSNCIIASAGFSTPQGIALT